MLCVAVLDLRSGAGTPGPGCWRSNRTGTDPPVGLGRAEGIAQQLADDALHRLVEAGERASPDETATLTLEKRTVDRAPRGVTR